MEASTKSEATSMFCDSHCAFTQEEGADRVLEKNEIWNLYREGYANGSPRPLFRGWIHGFMSALLVPSILCVDVAVGDGWLQQPWWLLSLMLLGKLASYTASAFYHLHPAQNVEHESELLKWDLAAIPIAMWAPSSVFALDAAEWTTLFGAMLAVSAVNLKLVEDQIEGKGAPLPRSALLLLYFAFCVSHIGGHYGHHGYWLAGVGLYLMGFAVSPPVHHNFPPAPWHDKGRNGWHEDFHLLLFGADACFLLMAVEFLRQHTT